MLVKPSLGGGQDGKRTPHHDISLATKKKLWDLWRVRNRQIVLCSSSRPGKPTAHPHNLRRNLTRQIGSISAMAIDRDGRISACKRCLVDSRPDIPRSGYVIRIPFCFLHPRERDRLLCTEEKRGLFRCDLTAMVAPCIFIRYPCTE